MPSSIAHLKVQLREARLNLERQETLTRNREEAEQLLDSLRKELEKIKRLLHERNAPSDDPLRERALQLEHQITQLRKTLSALDRQLDELDDTFLERAEELKKRLLDAIIEEFPHKRQRWDLLQQEMQDQLHRTQSLSHLVETLRDVVGYLFKANETALSTRGRGLLGYILGTNPNVVISQCLKRAEKSCRELESNLTDLFVPAATEGLLVPLRELLRQIVQQTGHRWSFQSVTKVITPLAQQLEQLLNQLESHLQKTESAVIDLEKELEEWLELDTP